jgi:hypothetical protein
MRPHGGCSGRPASPAANDPTGTLGTTWVNAPKDCPAWYLASDSTGSNWNSQGGHSNIPANTMIDCEAGDLKCYLIDIHFDLVYSDGTRTVLGNPENDAGDANYGWAKGSFFMYDPEIGTGDAVSGSVNDASTDAENASTDGESSALSTDGEVSAAPTVATSAKALVLAALGALLL